MLIASLNHDSRVGLGAFIPKTILVLISMRATIDNPRLTINESFKAQRIAMNMPQRIFWAGFTRVNNYLDNMATRFLFKKIVPRIWKTIFINWINSKTRQETFQQCVLTFCDVVSRIVEKRCAAGVMFQGIKTVCHILQNWHKPFVIKTAIPQSKRNPKQILQNDLVIHGAKLEMHSIRKNLFVYLSF